MIALFTETEFNAAKHYDKLACQCIECESIFYLTKKRIKDIRNPNKQDVGEYCSLRCHGLAHRKRANVICLQCAKIFEQTPSQIAQSTSENHFCSQSCAATYNNQHKTTGTRRSKLEQYLEEQLSVRFPKLDIHYNQKNTINSELDIYIPSLLLAFELNGIFHYEPIYGVSKLSQIQNNDQRKFQACVERGIEMCIIDASGLKYFKPERARMFLEIITNIINSKN